jgi:nucleoid-associated protein YgaU
MDCYLCDNEATKRCPRCGNPYCGDHGEDPSTGSGQALCADCLSPVNATPSGAFFRASLLALLLGSVLALWLLIRPPGLPGESSGVNVPEATPLPQGTPTPAPTITPTLTPVASATAAPTPTPTPAPTAEPTPAPIEYTVVDGDTWFGIADAYGVDATALATYNGLTLEDLLQPGQVLTIPQ